MNKVLLFLLWCIAAGAGVYFLPLSLQPSAIDLVVPFFTALLALLLLGLPQDRRAPVAPAEFAVSLLWLLAAVLAFLLILPVGYWLGWSSFTYGAISASEEAKRRLLLFDLPLLILATLAFEWALRQRLFNRLLTLTDSMLAVIFTTIAGVLLQWPRLMLSVGWGDQPFSIVSTIMLVLVELAATLLMRATGRLIVPVIFHVVIRVVQVAIMGDVLNPYMPLANYSSTNPFFYWSSLALPLLLVLTLFAAPRRRSAW